MKKGNVTEHFEWDEFTKSHTARKLRIDNSIPTEYEIKIQHICENILEPIRKAWGRPLVVSSGYRCPRLNKAVGGAKHSQHMLGEAVDIHTMQDTKTENYKLFLLIKQLMDTGEIKVGQLIDEYNYNWVHVSLPTSTLKNQVLHIK